MIYRCIFRSIVGGSYLIPCTSRCRLFFFFFFQAEDGIRDIGVTGVQTCALPISVRRLGWRTLKVWVRSGISDRLSELLAQQDENAMRKPLSALEATELYQELKKLHAEDAARRQAATQFGAEAPSGGENGAGHCPAPSPIRGEGDSRNQAAKMITGEQSYHRFERIAWLERIAADTSRTQAIQIGRASCRERV